MSYFFGFPSLFTYEEKKASPVKSTEEEKLTKGKQNGQQESKEIMGSASRKGWLDWQFWKKSDNSGGPFGAFRKNNKNTGAFTFRKEVSDAVKTKDNGKGEGSKDEALNVSRSASESGGEEGQSKTTENETKADRTDGGKSSLSDHGKDAPLVTYTDRPHGGKDVPPNMRKVQASRDTTQNGSYTQRGTAPSVAVLEEKYSPNGQAQPAMKPESKGSSTEATCSSPANKQKITTTAKPKTAIRQLPTIPKEQKRTVPQQLVVPTVTKTTQRQDTAPKLNPDAKIVAGKTNAERKPVETMKIDKKNEVRKVGDAKKTAVKKNEGLSQTQKSVLQKPVIARANLAKIDEKPSISSGPGKTVVKTGAGGQFKQKDAATKQMVEKSKTEANKSAAQETGNKKNVANGSPGLGNATVPKNFKGANSVTASQQRPAPEGVSTHNLPPQNQRLTRLQNSGAQVPKRNVVVNSGVQNGSKPPNLQPSLASQQQQRVGPQTPKAQNIGPQNAKSQNIGPQCPKPSTQDPRVRIQQCEKLNHTPQLVGSNSITSQPQAPGVQQSQMQKPMPQIGANQQFPIPHNQSEIAPPSKRSYSEVANPQKSSPQRPRPEGVSPHASPVRTTLRQKQAVNRRRAPGHARPVKPTGETQPPNGETTRQDPKESDNVPKRRILYSRDGREIIIEPNMPVTLPGSLVNTQENKNVPKRPTDIVKKLPVHNTMPKIRPVLPAIQEIPAQQVKPVMKDASTCTLTPTSLVDAAVQVPDEEESAGDEIENLLVKRPWDTERVMKMQVLLDEKLVVIGRMREMLRKRRDELKSTKKRSSELETVIKASNMQGKPQLVAQVNELTDIKNELVTEVTNLTVELEKERTNVKCLKTELVDVRAQLTAARKKGANPTGQ